MKTAARVELSRGDLPQSTLLAALAERRCAVDIETTGLDWRTEQIATVQVYVPNEAVQILHALDAVPQNLVFLMESVRVQKVLHHSLFDLRFMSKRWGVRPNWIADTKIAARISHPGRDSALYSLAALAKEHFGVVMDKSMRLSDWQTETLTESQLAYAAGDVEFLIALLDNLMNDAVDAGMADSIEAAFAYIPERLRTDIRECGDVFSY